MAETGAMTATQAVPPPRKHRHRYHGLIAFRLLSECETIPGLRTLGNLRLLRTSCPRTRGQSERSSWTRANHSNRRRCRPPAARPPTGASSSRSTFDRDIFQTSPHDLPAIDIPSL